MGKIGVGVVGYGLSATAFHLPFIKHLSSHYLLKAVLKRKGGEIPEQQQGVKVVQTMPELLAIDGLDLVIVTTPPDTHVAFAEEALLAGKHVLLEKPMCPSASAAAHLAHVAVERNLILAVFQNRRYDSDLLTAQQVLREGRIGRLVEFEAHFDRFRPQLKEGGNTWKEDGAAAGGGILFDLGSHLLDQALFLLGPPLSLSARLFKQREGTKIHDAFHVVLYYQDFTATLKAGMLLAQARPRFALYGTKGSFVKGGLDVQEGQLRAGMPPSDPSFGWEPEEIHGTLAALGEDGQLKQEKVKSLRGDYVSFFEQLALAIEGKGKPPVSGGEARDVVRLIEMCYQSHEEQKIIPWNES